MHDEDRCKYIAKDKVIFLTPLENIALALLIKSKGKIVTKDMLCKALYCCELDIFLECRISSLINRLNKKLEGECRIVSKRKRGYFIELKEMKANNDL